VEVNEVRGDISRGATPSLLPLRRAAGMARELTRVADGHRAIYLPEFNQALTVLALPVARVRGIPVVVDFLVSLFDTAVRDRGNSRLRPRAGLLWLADHFATWGGDVLIADTRCHETFFCEEFGTRFGEKAATVHIGTRAPARAPVAATSHAGINVLFVGTYIPLHGVETILGAASLLRHRRDITFTLVGRGQTYPEAERRVRAEHLTNVTLRPPTMGDDLTGLMASCDIALGVFGTSAKARRVVPNKVWLALESGMPIITGDNEAIREVAQPEKEIVLVPHGDERALSVAIERLAGDAARRRELADGAFAAALRFSSESIAQRFLEAVGTLGHR
jgi:glycosyltransferase involved in cell wall biosynthesis